MLLKQIPSLRLCGRRLFSSVGHDIKFPIVTADKIENAEIVEVLGLATGSTVRARNVVKDVFSEAQSIIGGELAHYTALMKESREEALERLREDAQSMGANAVVTARLSSSNIAAGSCEVLAYGTAVRIAQK